MLLSDAINKNNIKKSHPIDQGIEYFEIYKIAWFIASEFKYNNVLAVKTIKENTEPETLFLKSSRLVGIQINKLQ